MSSVHSITSSQVIKRTFEYHPDINGVKEGPGLPSASSRAATAAGSYEDVAVVVAGAYVNTAPMYCAADDAGGLTSTEAECDESNNVTFASLACSGVSVAVDPAPRNLGLEPAQPNPFGNQTSIAFTISRGGTASMPRSGRGPRHLRRRGHTGHEAQRALARAAMGPVPHGGDPVLRGGGSRGATIAKCISWLNPFVFRSTRRPFVS